MREGRKNDDDEESVVGDRGHKGHKTLGCGQRS